MLFFGIVIIGLLSILIKRADISMMNLLEECGTYENEQNKNIILSIPSIDSSEPFIFQDDIPISIKSLTDNGEKIDTSHKFVEMKGTVEN